MVEPPCKIVSQFLKKLNIYLPYNPAVLLLGIYHRAMKTYYRTKTYVTVLVIVQNWNQPRCSIISE